MDRVETASSAATSDADVEEEEEEDASVAHPTRDTLAEGLMGLLKPTVDRLDACVSAARRSQAELRAELEALLADLSVVGGDGAAGDAARFAACPEFDECARRLLNSKQRITVVAALLQASQERLNRIHQMASKEAAKRAALLQQEEEQEPSTSTDPIVVDSEEEAATA